MQIANLTAGAGPSMTSREIADLVEKRHDNVKRTIDDLTSKGLVRPQSEDEPFADALGRPRTETVYRICKRDSYVLVAQLSPEFTARLVDRWQELEAGLMPKVPTTLAQALRLAAEQAEQIDLQQAQIEAAQPAVEFVDRYVEAKSLKGLREVAKILGIREREFVGRLSMQGVIFKQGNYWLPKAEHQHAGYFEVKTGESNGHAYHQMKFTPAGVAWIAARVAKAEQKAA